MNNTEELSKKEHQQDSANSEGSDTNSSEHNAIENSASSQSSLEKYCDENPSASECLIYEE
jgi:hypothetical protein